LVVLHEGRLLAYLAKSDRALRLFLDSEEPERSQQLAALLAALQTLVGPGKRRALLLQTIDRVEAHRSALAPAFIAAGFTPGASGLGLRRAGAAPEPELEALEDAGG
jgi:ATP-dependent Lhr-like helicase